MAHKNWTQEEIDTLKRMAGKQPIMKIAEALGRTEASVYLFCYRNHIALRKNYGSNPIRKMFDIRFGDWQLFTPNRAFYNRCGISQKRFQDIFQGFAPASSEEIKAVAKAINLSSDEAFELMGVVQMSLFPEYEEK